MKRHARSLLSRSPRSKLLAAGASFAAIALFVLILPATVASGQTSASTSTLQNAGVLRLHLGATGAAPQDYFALQLPDGSGYVPAPYNKTQSISTSSGCRLSLSGQSLVSLSAQPSNGYPGFFSDAIGVGGGGDGAGQPCSRIDPGQSLTMDLSTGVTGKVIDYAELDLELKFGGAVTVTGKLVQGTTTTTMASETYTSTGSDSGPDSGDLDNYRVRFPRSGKTVINQLVFSVGSVGSGSLEGGVDGTGPCDAADAAACGTFSLGKTLANTTDTLFHLIEADGLLNCGQTAPPQGGGTTPTNSLERLDNVDGAACTPIPFNLDSSITNCGVGFLQCILLQKDLLGQDAQFYWSVTWAPEDGSYMETPTQFDFGTASGLHPLELCGPDNTPEDPTFIPTLPSNGDPWCVVDTQTNLQPDGQVIITERYFGSGDPLGKRG